LEALRILADAFLVVVVLHRLAEALQCASEIAAERLQPLRAEDQYDDQQNDQELPDTDSAESHVQPSWRGSKVSNDTPKGETGAVIPWAHPAARTSPGQRSSGRPPSTLRSARMPSAPRACRLPRPGARRALRRPPDRPPSRTPPGCPCACRRPA